jgi:hypothetical protein
MVACPNEKGLSLKKTLPVIRKNLTNDINMNNVNWESFKMYISFDVESPITELYAITPISDSFN